MYEFQYDYIKRKYSDNKLKLCYMDTDSLIYSIRTEDFYRDIAEDVEARFDTSGYVPYRPLLIGKNKKVIELMKDELGGEIMKEFMSLRPKMYSYRIKNSEPKKCKGIKKCVVKQTISFEDYKRCLFDGDRIHRSQLLFRSSKHRIRTLELNKLALSREDDKRISIDGIVVMNKPVYLGQAILDLSKTIMYEFHYDYMKRKYSHNKLKLCYMDTDSLIYSIRTEDFYRDIAEDVEARFDTSGYVPDRPLPIGENKKVIELMKDELGGEIMKEFISLRPKMYSYRVKNSEPKKCKGIKKCVVKQT